MNYLMKSWGKVGKQKGGSSSDNEFAKRLVKILETKYKKQEKPSSKHMGGMIIDKLYKIVAPIGLIGTGGTTAFSATVLLILLDLLVLRNIR